MEAFISVNKMFSQEEIEQQQKLLATYHRTLTHLVQQAAQYGGEVYAPLATANGIHEARENIRRIKASLRTHGVTVEDYPDEGERIDIHQNTSLFVHNVHSISVSQDHVYALTADAQDAGTGLDDVMFQWAVSSDGVLTIDGEKFNLDKGLAYFYASFLLMSARDIVITRIKLILSHQESTPSLEHFRLLGDVRYRDVGAGPVPGLSFYEFEVRSTQNSYHLVPDDRYDDQSRLPYELKAHESINVFIPVIFPYAGIFTLHVAIEALDYLGETNQIATPDMYFRHLHAPVQALQKLPASLLT